MLVEISDRYRNAAYVAALRAADHYVADPDAIAAAVAEFDAIGDDDPERAHIEIDAALERMVPAAVRDAARAARKRQRREACV